MKKIKYFSIITGVVLTLAMTILLTNPETSQAAEKCRTVSIEPTGIIPDKLSIDKGDCVVWINWAKSRGETVKVIFREGQKCSDLTKAAVGFKMDPSGCYLTEYLNYGGTASLLFPEPGTFIYEVEYAGEAKPYRGTIIVK
jgi:hypothetical protein